MAIKSWTDMKAYIAADYYSRQGGNRLKEWLFDPVARALILMRVNEYLLNSGWPLLLRFPLLFWYRRLSVRLGFSIPLNVFGPGVALPHYGTIIIDPNTRIGRNCRMHVGVNIGGSNKIVDPAAIVGQDAPIIGDNVYIGPGAKLYGPTTIGSNCVIGTNAVLTKSFPEHGKTIAGVPAKIIRDEGSEGRLIRGCDRVAHLSTAAQS